MDSMSGCDIRLVFTFPPKDSTLQYKKYVYTSEKNLVALVPCQKGILGVSFKDTLLNFGLWLPAVLSTLNLYKYLLCSSYV